MKRLTILAAAVLSFAAVAVASAFGAGGKGSQQPITALCTTSGNVTVHASSGQSAWVNNTHWVVLRFTGTFTPAGSTTSQTFTKVYGQKKGLVKTGTVQTCTGSQTDTHGTFSFTATVAKTTR